MGTDAANRSASPRSEPDVILDVAGLAALVAALTDHGYDVYAPQIRDGVIIHDRLRSVDDLPIGWTDEQAGGRYHLKQRDDEARFGYAVGPSSPKSHLHPPRTRIWSMDRAGGTPVSISDPPVGDDESGIRVTMHEPEPVPRAFLGVRPCELSAITKQDRVLVQGPHPDAVYRANREGAFLITVDCGDPADTCFCPSMGTGPRSGPGYDLAMTELVDGRGADVRYLTRPGSARGAALLSTLDSHPATAEHREAARRVTTDAEARMVRRLDTTGIRELLYDNLESRQWDDVAERCLTCGNCTQACPTCFCTNLEDVTDLSGATTDRWRVWDSCFSLEFSHLGPGPIRASAKSRYRQWLVHKLAGWIDQFDESGCVGCGRCITWCPVGIDLTEELARMREPVEDRS